MENTDTIIIDIQFVVGNEKEYFIKEMAIFELETAKSYNYIFKSKFHYSKLNTHAKIQNYYNYKNINGLLWKDGDLNYQEISNVLNKFISKTIIVRGEDKKRVLKYYLPTTSIIDLEMNIGLESCDDPGVCCSLHKYRPMLRCAYRNIFKIKQYLSNNKMKY